MSIDHNPGVAEWREEVCAWLRQLKRPATVPQIAAQFREPPTTMKIRDILLPAVGAGVLMASGTGEQRCYLHTGSTRALPRSGGGQKPFASIESRNVGRFPSVFHFAQGVTA